MVPFTITAAKGTSSPVLASVTLPVTVLVWAVAAIPMQDRITMIAAVILFICLTVFLFDITPYDDLMRPV